MAGFSTVFAYKELILNRILNDELLIRAIYNPGTDALGVPVAQPEDLLYDNIYPYKRKDTDIESSTKNYLMFDFAATGDPVNIFNYFSITFYTLVHKSMNLINYNGQNVVRTDFIAHRIQTLFSDTRGLSIGKLSLETYRPLENIPQNFLGVASIYVSTDFNK